MNYWSCELFEEDLKSKNYMQLADWLIACHEVVKRENYDTDEEYLDKLEAFCLEWEEHYNKDIEQNGKNSIYLSEKFKKALAYIRYKERLSVTLDFGNGIYEYPKDTYDNQLSSFFAPEKTSKYISNDFLSGDYEKILEIFKPENKSCYRAKLHDVISEQSFCDVTITIRAFKDKEMLKTMSYREFLKECENDKHYKEDYITTQKKSNYNESLKFAGISKTVYNDFQNASSYEKQFDKKLFVNIAFLLGLNYSYVEKLLNYNGYTFEDSSRQFDIICSKAFKIGFSRQMTIDLIQKRNNELLKLETKFVLIPNLTSNK